MAKAKARDPLSCHCGIFNLIVRILSVIALAGMGAAAGYLCYLGVAEYTAPETAGALIGNDRIGVFHVVIGIWFMIFAILGLIGEIRVRWCKTHLLAPFGFLHGFVGRGVSYLLLGCIFCAIPVLPVMNYVTIAPGAVLCIAGLAQVGLGCFVVPASPADSRGADPRTQVRARASGGAAAAFAAPSGVTSGAGDDDRTASVAASSQGGDMGSPAVVVINPRQALVGQPKGSNPFRNVIDAPPPEE